MSAVRTVIAAPLFNAEAHVRGALESLLAETRAELALVLVDDASTDATAAIAGELAARDPRVTLRVNDRRLGTLENTRRAWALARELHPAAEFVALGSDHDEWHPRWLAALTAELDAHPEAVLAYPLVERIDAAGRPLRGPWRFETRGIADPRARARLALRRMVAGDMVYGLMRAAGLERAGAYRSVARPDRLLLAELALQGPFHQVPEVLWRRRFAPRGLADQRAALHPGGAPAGARLPPLLAHPGVIAWEHGVRGRGPLGRAAGVRHALADHVPAQLSFAAREQALRARDAALAPPAHAVLARPRGRALARARVLPALAFTREVLERLVVEIEQVRGER